MRKLMLTLAMALAMTGFSVPSAEAVTFSRVCSVCEDFCHPGGCFVLCRFTFTTGSRGADLCIEQTGPGGEYCTLYGSCIVVSAI